MIKLCRQSLAVPLMVLFIVACSTASPQAGTPSVPPPGVAAPLLETAPARSAPSAVAPTALPVAPTGTPTAIPSPTAEPTLAPNPLTVRVTKDPGLGASAVISETGGTISARGLDGTHFVLAVPPGAVDQATQITVTPMTSVEGLPLSGGLVAGVDLQPEGLRFGRPVTLTIQTSQLPGSKEYQAVAFSAQSDGQEFHLYPSRTEGQQTTILLAHFSSKGLGRGTQADIATQKREHAPSQPMDRLYQDTAGQYDRAVIVKRMTDAYLYIESRVDNARTGAELEAANGAFADWLTALLTLGLWDDLKDNFDLLQSLFAVRVHDLIDRLAQECVNGRDLRRIGELLKWYRRALPGSGWSIAYWIGADAQKKMESSVNRCVSFNLEFESTVRTDFSLITAVWSARATIHLRPAEGGRRVAGSTPMELTLKETGNTPALRIYDAGATGGDLQASFDLFGRKSDMAKDFDLGDIVLVLSPGQNTRFSLQQACSPVGCGPQVTNREPIWRDLFRTLHEDESGSGGIELRGWTVKSSGPATKLYSRSKSIGNLSVQEVTSLWLVHTPGK